MSISEELKTKILRYYYVEKWRVGTISSQLGVHHTTIKKVLSETGVPKDKILVHASMIDPYLSFVLETLERYPKLRASRLYAMVKERGYPGGIDHFRHLISCYRPRPAAEAYLRLRTLPGEQAQVDWGHFGHLEIGQAKRPLVAFVMVLSYSRKIFLQFFLSQRMECFLSGHSSAFLAFGGVPRVLLYDNLKSAVLERMGDAIRFNPTLLHYAAHHRFEPRPVAVARGNEKGRVERAIRYVRDHFFAARCFKDLEDLNAQAAIWCEQEALCRPCPEDRNHKVQEVFQAEQPRLLALPEQPYPIQESESVRVGKTPYVRFDLNDYSVPHQYVNKTLSVWASLNEITITHEAKIVAKHPRSYDKARQIEEPKHIEDLSAQKKKARCHRGQHRLTQALSQGHVFLEQAAQKGYVLRGIVKDLIQLLEDYGAADLDEAMKEALMKDVAHPNAVRINLQRLLDERNQAPPISLDCSKDKRVRDLVIKPHALTDYDSLNSPKMEKE